MKRKLKIMTQLDQYFQSYRKANSQQELFSEQFKYEKVQALMNKQISLEEVCRTYQLDRRKVLLWVYQYSTAQPPKKEFDETDLDPQMLSKKVDDLEDKLVQQIAEKTALLNLIELASKEFGIDLRKRFGSPTQ